MKADEIMEYLFSLATMGDFTNTCDTCKAGDPYAEVQRIAVAMFGTPYVIGQAREWGADLLIVHEPLYYNHMDKHRDEEIEDKKRALIRDSGMTVWRYHDHAHMTDPDVIGAGMLEAFGISGRVENRPGLDHMIIYPDTPVSPAELARRIEERCGIAHLRICGNRDNPCSRISCMFGTPGGVFEELRSPDCQLLLTGEACEWSMAEYARDAYQLGYNKSLIIMGHIGSERDGMRYTARLLGDRYPGLEVRYFECGEVYRYTEE